MKNRKIKMVGFKIVCLALLVWFSGCNPICYDCEDLFATIFCYKGADTIITTAITLSQIEDKVNFYQSMGYRCDTALGYISSPTGPFTVCGRPEVKHAIQQGGICTDK